MSRMPRLRKVRGKMRFLYLSLMAVLAWAACGHAEPYLAVRNGMKCSFCHVNLTGGGKRTQAYAGIARQVLKPTHLLNSDKIDRKRFTSDIAPGVSLGANLRAANTTVYRDEPDAQGEVENNVFFRDEVDSNDFDVTEAVAYLQVDLIDDALMFYLDESFAPGTATNRETFGMLHGFLPWGGYIKAGKFFPKLGLRLEDDTTFIRSATGFNFDNPGTGVELGLDLAGFQVSASVTNGDDVTGDDTDKLFTINGSYLFGGVPAFRTILLGAGYSSNQASERDVATVYLGWNIWRMTFLTEADFISDNAGPDDVSRWAGHFEVDWQLVDWLNLKLGYGYFEPDDDIEEDERDLVFVGLEPFIDEFLQFRLIYRSFNDVPQNPQNNFAELIAEMHFFF